MAQFLYPDWFICWGEKRALFTLMSQKLSSGKKYRLTKQVIEELKKELEFLVKNRRVEVAERLASARDYGDISDNAEFDIAREEQAFIEGRIVEIEAILRQSDVGVRGAEVGQGVQVGSVVEVETSGQVRQLTITAAAVGNPMGGEISQNSPLAKAIIGSKAGEVVDVKTPGGELRYKILKIVRKF